MVKTDWKRWNFRWRLKVDRLPIDVLVCVCVCVSSDIGLHT